MTALGRSYGGVTAAVKYFTFGTLGSVFLFWSVVHIYAMVPTLSYGPAFILFQAGCDHNIWLQDSLHFVSAGLCFGFLLKIGAAPTHQWVADVYAGVHMFITTFFSVLVKLVLMIVFIPIASRLHCDSSFKFFVVVSLVWGCVMAVRQTEVKRLLAYSSIVHVGFFIMGDSSSSVFYILTYVISNLLLFSVILTSDLAGKEVTYLNDLRFLRNSSYSQTLCFVVALASSAGLPPLAGFYGKFMVWSSLIEDIQLFNDSYSYLIFFISVTVSLVTIYYYMRATAYVFIGDDNEPRSAFLGLWHGLSFSAPALQVVLATLILFWTIFHTRSLTTVQLIMATQ